jgi:hypothetical protein
VSSILTFGIVSFLLSVERHLPRITVSQRHNLAVAPFNRMRRAAARLDAQPQKPSQAPHKVEPGLGALLGRYMGYIAEHTRDHH